MIASDSFVFPGNVNLVFPHCSCKSEIYPLSSKSPSCILFSSGKFSGRQKISLSTNFPSLTCRGKLANKEILCFPLNFPLAWGKFRRQSTHCPSVTEYEVVGRSHPPIPFFTPRLTLNQSRLNLCSSWMYNAYGIFLRTRKTCVTMWICANVQSKINRKSCMHHVPEELISFLIQNAKSDALISLQPTSRW